MKKIFTIATLFFMVLLGAAINTPSLKSSKVTQDTFLAETFRPRMAACNESTDILWLLYSSPSNEHTYTLYIGVAGGGKITLDVDGHQSSVDVVDDYYTRDYVVSVTAPDGPQHFIQATGYGRTACTSDVKQYVQYALIEPGSNANGKLPALAPTK